MRTIRGRILRDTSSGDGLLTAEGKQYPFRLEGMWQGEVAPKTDMQVEVDLDEAGNIVAIRVIDPAALAREQAAKLAGKAGETAKQVAAEFHAKGLPVLKSYAALIGMPTLVAMGLLLLGWFFLATVSISVFGATQSATFYDLMKLLNDPQNAASSIMSDSGGGAGFYGFLTFAAFIAPFVPHFFKHPKAWYAYFAPIAWMALTPLVGYFKVRSTMSEATQMAGQFGGDEFESMAGKMASEALDTIMEMISMGGGFYVAIAAAACLAFIGFRKLGTA